jgi:hypothetical protein
LARNDTLPVDSMQMKTTARKLLVRLTPWVVAGGVLTFLFWRTPFSAVADATRAANGWMILPALFGLAWIYVADSVATKKTFDWFLGEFSLTDALIMRGATYLLAAVNYGVGQGAIAYFARRLTGVTIRRATGVVLLIMGTNVLLLLGLATLGVWLAPSVPRQLQMVILFGLAGTALYFLILNLRPAWLQCVPVLDVLLDAGTCGHLKALVIRIPHLVGLVFYSYTILYAFGVRVPFGQALLMLPVVFFVAVLPISVQGLGTSQAVAVILFSPYASGAKDSQDAAVLAASLVTQILALCFQMTVALICLLTDTGRHLRQQPLASD